MSFLSYDGFFPTTKKPLSHADTSADFVVPAGMELEIY